MTYLWLKAFHIIAMVAWFAGIFYLPRLFVYHAMSEDRATVERFKVMERKLYGSIMTPSMVLTLAFGVGMLFTDSGRGWTGMGWMHLKWGLVAALVGYHVWCGQILRTFERDANTRSHVWFRVFNEVPTVLLIAVVLLVVLKPAL